MYLYLCFSPPYHLQTKIDRRTHEYTQAAFAGAFEEARRIRDSLDHVGAAIKANRPAGEPTAHGTSRQELQGQRGDHVCPILELTQAKKDAKRAAFEGCGLTL